MSSNQALYEASYKSFCYEGTKIAGRPAQWAFYPQGIIVAKKGRLGAFAEASLGAVGALVGAAGTAQDIASKPEEGLLHANAWADVNSLTVKKKIFSADQVVVALKDGTSYRISAMDSLKRAIGQIEPIIRQANPTILINY